MRGGKRRYQEEGREGQETAREEKAKPTRVRFPRKGEEERIPVLRVAQRIFTNIFTKCYLMARRVRPNRRQCAVLLELADEDIAVEQAFE